jgi:hypothetical protein
MPSTDVGAVHGGGFREAGRGGFRLKVLEGFRFQRVSGFSGHGCAFPNLKLLRPAT